MRASADGEERQRRAARLHKLADVKVAGRVAKALVRAHRKERRRGGPLRLLLWRRIARARGAAAAGAAEWRDDHAVANGHRARRGKQWARGWPEGTAARRS